MVIILKSICFTIWLVIMLYLIHGSRIKSVPPLNEVKIRVDEDEEAEIKIRQALKKLKIKDRLIIENLSCDDINARIIDHVMARNPSILCTIPSCM